MARGGGTRALACLPVVFGSVDIRICHEYVHCGLGQRRGQVSTKQQAILYLTNISLANLEQPRSVGCPDGLHWVGHFPSIKHRRVMTYHLGGAISFTVGGMITTRMDNVVPVYGVAGAMLAAAWAYVYFILPESFPREKREELRRQRLAQAQEAASADTQQQKGQRVLAALAVPLEPLKQLRPSHNPVTRRRNWRLLYCAVHAFFAEVGGSYSVLSIITFLTTRYNYTPAEVRVFVTLPARLRSDVNLRRDTC